MPLGKSMLDLLPTPARLYLESLSGEQSPITEQDFSKDELDAMRRLVAVGQKGGVSYDAYANATPSPSLFNSPLTTSPGIAGLLTPQGRVANSLGQFNYEHGPEGTTISDEYDFNPMYKDPHSLLEALDTGTDPFALMHMIGEYLRPPGKGRPVRVKLK